MKTRRAFVEALFQVLEGEEIPYCVLRNFDDVYEDASSDLDVGVEPEQVSHFKRCLNAAAAGTGFCLVHQARYTNYSFVYRHPQGAFVRVDVETEIRWRVFPVLNMAEIIALRRKRGAFYVPDPRHESVILFVAAVWRDSLRERYKKRLGALAREIANDGEPAQIFGACFGRAGRTLEAMQRAAALDSLPTLSWSAVKRSLVFNAFRSGRKLRAVIHNVAQDWQRFWQRLSRPPGIALLYLCGGEGPEEDANLFKRLEFLYPVQKLVKHTSKVSLGMGPRLRLSWTLRWRRVQTLFRGGMFVSYYRVLDNEDTLGAIQRASRCLYPSRVFFFVEPSAGCCWMGHPHTKFIRSCQSETRHAELIGFITAVLMRELNGSPRNIRNEEFDDVRQTGAKGVSQI